MKPRLLLAAALPLLLGGCEALMYGNVIVGCALRPEPQVTPEVLPVAVVGEPYRARIEVIKTSTPLGGLQVAHEQPLPPGLELVHGERDPHALIQGVPRAAGRYPVRLSGWTYGTQCTGQEVRHEYQLEVRRAAGE